MAKRVTLELQEAMRFRARTGSGHEIAVDASPDVGGTEGGARPTELVLVALGACGAMDVISMLRKMREDVTAYSVEVTGEQATEHPKRYVAIEMTHRVRGNDLREHNVRRAITLSTERYCPVYAMLSPIVPITVRYEIADEAGGAPLAGVVSAGAPELPAAGG